MKKEKKTKQKKTKKYKIWFVIMVVPILLSVLPITTYAVETASITTDYIDSMGLAITDNNNTTYSYAEFDRISTTEITTTVKGTKYGISLYYITRPNYKNITHVTASFEIRNTENGTPVKRLSSITPKLQTRYNNLFQNYNLNIITYVNRYKYTIDTDISDDQGLLYFYFNIESHEGDIEINYIDIQITYETEETTTEAETNVDLSGIESQLDNLNEQISGLTNDDDYIGLNNISMVRVYGVRNDPNNNPTLYTIDDYTVDNNVLKFDTLYTTYQEILRFTFDTVDIKSIQIQLRSNMLLSDGTILRNISEYQPIISYGIQPPTPNGTYNDIMNRMPINSSPVHYLYTYENDNVNKNGITTLWIRLNMRGVSVTNQIWDIKIKINDIEYQVKISGQNAQDAVSNYESEVNELEPDPIDIEAENSWLESKYQEYLDNIVETYPQYNWFGVVIYDNAIIMVVIIFSIIMMGAGFILYGKK